jgi:hypothetical protein
VIKKASFLVEGIETKRRFQMLCLFLKKMILIGMVIAYFRERYRSKRLSAERA